MMAVVPIPARVARPERRLLRDDVFRQLRDAIVDGTFQPGEQLKDSELAEWLGVSRTPVREALLRLVETGLVCAEPGRSTTVTPLHERDLRGARDVVAALHQLAVRQAVERLTDDDIETMRRANERFREAISTGDVEAALTADAELHAVPVHVTANKALSAVLEQHTPLLRRAERLRFSSEAGHASVARHERLIACCVARDAEGAASIEFDTFHSLLDDER